MGETRSYKLKVGKDGKCEAEEELSDLVGLCL